MLMEADLHIVGAIDALHGNATDAQFVAELLRRGLTPGDALLLLDQGLLLRLVERASDGTLRRGPEMIRRERLAGEAPDSQ
jgi:hypothetical protein